jgi:hypothetical protein
LGKEDVYRQNEENNTFIDYSVSHPVFDGLRFKCSGEHPSTDTNRSANPDIDTIRFFRQYK